MRLNPPKNFIVESTQALGLIAVTCRLTRKHGDFSETNSAKEAKTFMVPTGGVGICSVTGCHMLQKTPQIVVDIGHLRWGKIQVDEV